MKILPRSPRSRLWLAALAGTVGVAIASLGNAAEPPSVASDSISRDTTPIDGAGQAPAFSAKPRIGRIFFSPTERRRRRSVELEATPAESAVLATIGGGNVSSERLVVNGALSTGANGRAVWVNGKVVENTVRNKSAWTDRNGNVWVINQDRTTRLILPGQSIDRFGVVQDLVPPGAVTRH
jgi:hypothetical protein